MNNLILAGTPVIEIPKKMLSITSKGKFKEIPTLTTTRAITTRNKKKVIKFEPTEKNHINIKNEGQTKKSRVKDLFKDIENKYYSSWREYDNLLPAKNYYEKEIEKLKSLKKLTKDKKDKLDKYQQEYKKLIENFNEIEKNKKLYQKYS